MDLYFNQEIRNRIAIVEKLGVDSILSTAKTMDKEINNIILLSKDVENLGASVYLGNACFKKLAKQEGFNNSDFTELTTGMHVNDIATVLKQNELNFLNQLLLKNNPSGLPLFTAQ
jgi:hypothetical protein